MTELELLGARRLRALVSAYDIHPSKALGQNFVIDPNTIRKMVAVASPAPDDSVLEIGAGLGSLTIELARVAQRVTALEVDATVAAALRTVVAPAENVDVVEGDALALDLGSFGASAVVANLPYNIASSIVLRVLEAAPQIARLTVMTQREVGERLASPPGSKTYGATSVFVAYWGKARVAATVSRRAFYPEPNVDSVIVVIDRRSPSADVDQGALFSIVRAAFGQRRKVLRNSLAELTGAGDAAASLLTRAGIDPRARAEQLGLDDFIAVARAFGPAAAEERHDPAL